MKRDHILGLQDSILSKWLPYKAINMFSSIATELPMSFFTEWKHFKNCTEIQKIRKSQNNLEKEKCSWRNQAPWLQTILQSHSNQTVWYRHKNRHIDQMGQDRKPRDKPTPLWSINLPQRRQEYAMEKRYSLQKVVPRRPESYM